MKPTVEHLGHACTKFSYGNFSLVTDPFFFAAVLKSWFPWPNNREFISPAREADYFYVSHAHEDHFDRKFLADSADTPVIIPRFRSKFLEREMRSLGMTTVHALGHGESLQLAKDIRVTMLIDRSHKEDSALLIDTGSFRYLDSNDCELAIPDWPSDIDVLAAQFSGAFWYPHCYNFSPAVMKRKIREVRDNNMMRLTRRVKNTGAVSYLPSAGPPMFLDPELEKYNDRNGIFPLWEDVSDEFRQLNPAVSILTPFSREYTVADIREYRDMRADEWTAWALEPDNAVTAEELLQHFEHLTKTNKRWLRDYSKTLRVTSDEQAWNIPIAAVKAQLEEPGPPHYFMDVPTRVLRAVVNGSASWEDALSSMRVRLNRKPDVYDARLMGLLNFGDRPVQTTTMAKHEASDETVVRDGWQFQRWCPHAGEDMKYASIEGDKVTCARHEWCWDLKTGECLTGQGIPLKTRGRVE